MTAPTWHRNNDTGMGTMTTLWPHQQAALTRIGETLTPGGRASVVMACGTGKTRVAVHTRRLLAPSGRVVVVVPTLELLYQSAREYMASPRDSRLIGVCTDAGRTGARHTVAEDELVELEGHGMLISTNPEQIASALREPGPVTVLVTFASLGRLAQATTHPFDLVVIDEAHRTAGLVGRAWSQVHDDQVLPAHRRLYMTATPRCFTDDGDGPAYSMDDTSTYGPVVYELPFAEAIENGLLAPYRTVVGVVADDEAARLAELQRDADMLSLDGHAMPAEMLAAQIALIRAIDEHDLQRVVTYHNTIAEAQRFSQTLLNVADLMDRPAGARPVAGYHVDGTMHLADRRFLVHKLHDPGKRAVVVSNCRVLAEGVDVPELDGVLFANPRDSATDIIQAIGRALRRGATESKTATIIVPVMTTDTESPASQLDTSRWSILWKIMRALRAHDERLADILDTARAQMSRRGDDTGEHLERWLTPTGMPITADLARAIQIKTVLSTTSSWWQSYGQAQDFHTAHGHLDIPADYPDANRIRSWLNEQRGLRRRGALQPDRERLLEKIGIVWDPVEHDRQRLLTAAASFRQEHGHLHVPDGHIQGDVELNYLLRIRREQHRTGQLSPETYSGLDELGMPWKHNRPRRWLLIEDLRAFHATHGHLDIPADYATEHRRVGSLLDKLLRRLGGSVNHFNDPEARAALQELGLHSTKAALREALVTAAERFLAEHGHLHVPADHIDPASRALLAGWLHDVQTGFITLSAPDTKRLTAPENGNRPISARSRRYVAERIDDLRAFHAQRGHIDIATNDESGLGRDLVYLRTKYRNGTLHCDDVAALEELGIIWSPKEQKFQELLWACDRYRAEHGDLAVRVDYIDPHDYPLGAKLVYYRQLAKGNVRGRLSDAAHRELTQRGMIWDYR